MTQPRTEALVDAAREGARSDPWKRDQIAWNLPRDPAAPASDAADLEELDWAEFSRAFYPGTGRHHLAAIVAYGAYRSSRRSV